MPEYTISDTALRRARKLGMYGDARGRLGRIAREAEPLVHPTATHRFGDYLLTIEGDVVLSITRAGSGLPGRSRHRATRAPV
jgi:hypothetical protein